MKTTYIAEKGVGPYRHRFGGTSWSVLGPPGSNPAPTLILTLDCSDPRFSPLDFDGEVPLCSRTDGIHDERQSYRFDPKRRVATFSGRPWTTTLDPADVLRNPLPEHPLRLRRAGMQEVVGPSGADDESVYRALDTFLGGPAFFRVLGDPLWIEESEKAVCKCGRRMDALAAIGYENYSSPCGLLPNSAPFFMGEFALYFFGCPGCLAIDVVIQG